MSAAELTLRFELSSPALELLEVGQNLSFLAAGAAWRERRQAEDLRLEITRLETLEGGKSFAIGGRFSASLEEGGGQWQLDDAPPTYP